MLALDGVYVRDKPSGRLVFHALPPPTCAEVADVAARAAERIEKRLRAHGRALDPDMQDGEPSAALGRIRAALHMPPRPQTTARVPAHAAR